MLGDGTSEHRHAVVVPSEAPKSGETKSVRSSRRRKEPRAGRRENGGPAERAASAAKGSPSATGDGVGVARRVEFVQSLERGFAVIRAFERDRTHMSVTEVAQATGLTRAVARRFLLTLVELGYVRNEGRSFSLRPRILELGYGYLSGLTFPEIARPYMEELSAKVQESVSAAVLDGGDIVYVANVVPRRVMTINVPIGGRDPAYCTSLGRVLLAQRSDEEISAYLASVDLARRTERTVTDPAALRRILREVREQGYALLDQELEDGLGAIAVPIHDAGGAVVAAMNVSAYSLRASPEVFTRVFLSALRETVVQVEEEVRVSVRLTAPAG